MSSQRTIDQERAALAWKAIEVVDREGEEFKKQYAAWARHAPADVMINGLGQTLAFMLAKGGAARDKPPALLYQHVSEWVTTQIAGWQGQDLLQKLIDRQSKSDVYRRAMAETLAYLVWLKRFAEAVLPEVTDAGD